jgi:hypothetical protein
MHHVAEAHSLLDETQHAFRISDFSAVKTRHQVTSELVVVP